MSDRYFKINEPDASTEDFQTEILAVNLKNGHYHSLRGSAAPLWRLLMEGHGTRAAAALLASIYGHDPVQWQAVVDGFVQELEKAELVVEAPMREGQAPEAPAWLSSLSSDYAEPLLESYTDMQDLLLLDPIHDVDVEGWPRTAPQNPKA